MRKGQRLPRMVKILWAEMFENGSVAFKYEGNGQDEALLPDAFAALKIYAGEWKQCMTDSYYCRKHKEAAHGTNRTVDR